VLVSKTQAQDILSTCEVEGPVSVSRLTTGFGKSSVELSGSTNTKFVNIYIYIGHLFC
jgi:hypothetical protein